MQRAIGERPEKELTVKARALRAVQILSVKAVNIALVGFLLTLSTVTSAQREVAADVVGNEPGGPSSLALERWQRAGLTLSFDPSLAALGEQAEPAIKSALLAWQETGAALPVVHFARGSGSKVSLRADGENTISYAPIEVEGHQNDLAITITFANPKTGEIDEADVVINSRHTFSPAQELPHRNPEGASPTSATNEGSVGSCNGSIDSGQCGGTYDLQNVLTHEFGHFFGLGEDFDDPGTTMFSCTSACETHKRDLAPADVDHILDSYAASPTEVAGCQPATWMGQSRWNAWGGVGRAILLSALLLLAAARRAAPFMLLPARVNQRQAPSPLSPGLSGEAHAGAKMSAPSGGKRSSSDWS